MYEDCLRRTGEEGFAPYEISNFALPGYECRHNLEYWTGGEYAAYGPGAVGMVREFSNFGLQGSPDAVRYTNLKHPVGYSDKVEAGVHPAYDVEPLTEADLRTERIMLGLRLDRGIREEGLDERSIRRLEGRGWLESFEGGLRLTAAGRHFHSEAAAELI